MRIELERELDESECGRTGVLYHAIGNDMRSVRDAATPMVLTRRRRILLAVASSFVVNVAGCIGSFVVEQNSFDSSGRDGMIEVFSDELLAVYAFPESTAAASAPEEAVFFGDLLGHYADLGFATGRQLEVYLHTWESFKVAGRSSVSGWASPGEFSVDYVWEQTESRYVGAHEIAHLAAYARAGTNLRPFLNEGLAEHLATSYPFAYEPSDEPGTIRDDFWAAGACDDDWSLHDIFSGSGWFRSNGPTYEVAGLFTEIAVGRLGVDDFLSEYFGPAASGTSDEGDRLLEEIVGLDFSEMEAEMRELACNQ